MSTKKAKHPGEEIGTPGPSDTVTEPTAPAASPEAEAPEPPLGPGEFLGEGGHVYRRVHEKHGQAWIDRTELVRHRNPQAN